MGNPEFVVEYVARTLRGRAAFLCFAARSFETIMYHASKDGFEGVVSAFIFDLDAIPTVSQELWLVLLWRLSVHTWLESNGNTTRY